MDIIEKVKHFINKIKNIGKAIKEALKFFSTILGQIVGWGILIIVVILLLVAIISEISFVRDMLKDAVWNYEDYETGLSVIRQLNTSGYESIINAENYQNFKAFEYAVLMDAAEYLRTSKPEMFDLYQNEYFQSGVHQYAYERESVIGRHGATQSALQSRINTLKNSYVNIGGGDEKASMELLTVTQEYNQSEVSDRALSDAIYSFTNGNNRNVSVEGVHSTSSLSTKGGNNRVTEPKLVYEFVAGESSLYESGSTSISGDESGEESRDEITKVIFVGDSRTVQMYNATWGRYPSQTTVTVDTLGNVWSCKGGERYNWMERKGVPQIESYVESNTAVVFLMGVNGVLLDTPQQYITYINGKAEEWKAKGAATFFVSINPVNEALYHGFSNSKIVDFNNQLKLGFSSDITYIDTYNGIGVSNFRAPVDGLHYANATYTAIYDYVLNAVNEEGSPSVSVSIEPGEIRGHLEPYIYVVRDNINYTYYFDRSNKVIEYPLILNVNNTDLEKSSERSKELSRALLGVSPVVFLDDNASSYTKIPYFGDENDAVTYKIPLRTIIGRYLPSQELLLAWSMLKQNVDAETESSETGEIVEIHTIIDDAIASIKGIYDEACLKNEEIEIDERTDGSDTNRYAKAKTNKNTFLTFEKVGLETTRYGINGEYADYSGTKERVRFVTSLVRAYTLESVITAKYRVPGGTAQYLEVTPGSLGISKTRGVILASGSEESGYTPPSSLDGSEEYYFASYEDAYYTITQAVQNFVINTMEETYRVSDISVEEVSGIKMNPVFVVGSTATVSKQLTIQQVRMPAILVKSASTWCREVEYEHKIIQNQFKPNDKHYIIPNSLTSTGLYSFETKLKDDDYGYRGKAYAEVFHSVQEKDVINMLLQLEEYAKKGQTDAYEYMRDLFRLIKSSQFYSVTKEYREGITEEQKKQDPEYINPDTYSYVYIPDSIYYYDDNDSQKIYWLNMLTATKDDPIKKTELNTMKLKNSQITWQVVEYDKYDECSSGGRSWVYAFNPYGSAYARALYEAMYQKGQDVSGNYNLANHRAADWHGRQFVGNYVKESSTSILDMNNLGNVIYDYELSRLSQIYETDVARDRLNKQLREEASNMPIVAVAPGYVKEAGYQSIYGFYVIIQHGKSGSGSAGTVTKYMHLKRWPEVSAGDFVGAGTLLGYQGDTGRSSGTHLHFEMNANGRSQEPPAEYVFPSFNPFYNEEKAAGVEYDLTSEYMSLYRTVRMVGEGSNYTSSITNQVPRQSLLPYADLINEPGKNDRESLSFYTNLELSSLTEEDKLANRGKNQKAWSSSEDYTGSSAEDYTRYLISHEYYDLYLEPAYLDKALAIKKGYLKAVLDTLPDDFIVKTDIAGGLPDLTRDEIMEIMDQWLPTLRSSDAVTWIKNNIFSETCLDAFMHIQEEYKVSPIFAIAVAWAETNLGLAQFSVNRISAPPQCNIFDIAFGTFYCPVPGGPSYWVSYGSYANAIESFGRLIGTKDVYFGGGNYTVNTIGASYCDVEIWGKAVNKLIKQMMKYYSGNWNMDFNPNSDQIIEISKYAMNYLVENGFEYRQGRSVPPYEYGGNTMDCSAYVSWVIYEYGKATHNNELAQAFHGWQHDSYGFKRIGDMLKAGKNTGDAQFFELIAYDIPGHNFGNVSDLIQPGDILVYREGTGHHVEIAAEEKYYVYTYGSTQYVSEPHERYTRRSDATYVLRLK